MIATLAAMMETAANADAHGDELLTKLVPGKQVEARELEAWADNRDTYELERLRILKRLCVHIAHRTYDAGLAVKAWENWYAWIARDYRRELEIPRTSQCFGPSVRRALAVRRAADEYVKLTTGQYLHPDDLACISPENIPALKANIVGFTRRHLAESITRLHDSIIEYQRVRG